MDSVPKAIWKNIENFDDIIYTPGAVGTVGHVRLTLSAEHGSREFDTEVCFRLGVKCTINWYSSEHAPNKSFKT